MQSYVANFEAVDENGLRARCAGRSCSPDPRNRQAGYVVATDADGITMQAATCHSICEARQYAEEQNVLYPIAAPRPKC